MYWKQESMENEVARIRAASKGQGFIYRTGATPLEEGGPFSPAVSAKRKMQGPGPGGSTPAPMVGNPHTVFTQISHLWEDERGEKVDQTLGMSFYLQR